MKRKHIVMLINLVPRATCTTFLISLMVVSAIKIIIKRAKGLGSSLPCSCLADCCIKHVYFWPISRRPISIKSIPFNLTAFLATMWKALSRELVWLRWHGFYMVGKKTANKSGINFSCNDFLSKEIFCMIPKVRNSNNFKLSILVMLLQWNIEIINRSLCYVWCLI